MPGPPEAAGIEVAVVRGAGTERSSASGATREGGATVVDVQVLIRHHFEVSAKRLQGLGSGPDCPRDALMPRPGECAAWR